MVWREVLVHGPLFYMIDSELFWDMRAQFIEKAFNSNLASYRRKVINEFKKLKKFEGEEIVLWFEYDLFCQVNLVALLSYLMRAKKNTIISLVCVGDMPGYDKMVGLGEIGHEEYSALYNTRLRLEKKDLLLADRAWMSFCSMSTDQFKDLKSDKLIYLEKAFEAAIDMLKREEGVSIIEKNILKLIAKNQFSKKELIKHLLEKDRIYGFGDLQYDYMLSEMKSFLAEEGNIVELNNLGKEVIV